MAAPDGSGGHTVVVDAAGNLPGRGAWLHADQQCLQAAIRRRAFARALRITGSPDTSAVVDHFTTGEAAVRRGNEEQVAKT
ncbi:YlxR family protein [Mycobacterium sp. MYCO198283]|uniref:YlxR family protein n=1 Tax=Mycobacterium sp. MYCO198283 TaxID=2883505 RepID=UPI0027DED2DE|nr:YlxR family protein [Mycobacterium sp. MYCO198283]